MIASLPDLMTRAQFARFLGTRKSYVTKLIELGRVKLSNDGRRIIVRESLNLLDQTYDPNRKDVRQRWARYRETRNDGAAASPKIVNHHPPPVASTEDLENVDVPDDIADISFTRVRTMREFYAAQKARLEFEQLSGELCRVEAVKRAGAKVGDTTRDMLEALPDSLAPLLAPVTDQTKVNMILRDHIEYILNAIADKLTTSVGELHED